MFLLFSMSFYSLRCLMIMMINKLLEHNCGEWDFDYEWKKLEPPW